MTGSHSYVELNVAQILKCARFILLQDMASFKIATLQKTREESVPLSELESANKQYQELTEKYRDLLDRSNNMIAKNEHSATLEVGGAY